MTHENGGKEDDYHIEYVLSSVGNGRTEYFPESVVSPSGNEW